MPRETFTHEVQRLETDLLGLSHMVQKAIVEAVDALKQKDFVLARRIVTDDSYVNMRRYDIEHDCLTLIATQQPTAKDLRHLSAIIAIVSELERIHDYAKAIGKITLLLGAEPLMKPLIDLPRMALKAQGMLHRSMMAFSRRDVALARAIPLEDDEVDGLYDQIYRELFTYALADPQYVKQTNYLLWAAHNLERTADRVTNICERVVFTVTGQMTELDTDETIMGLNVLNGHLTP
jgi:phosphate transport system protein